MLFRSFVAISKSGGTGETLMQTIAAISEVKAAGLDPHERFFGISEPAKPGKANGLRTLLESIDVPLLDHDPGVGGRFSVLTNVGILPAAVCGLDIPAIRGGAGDALTPILAGKSPAEVPSAVGAALSVAIQKPITVMMAYADKLERFTRWYVQLWAESLGKDGKGTTPVGALGPVDQHSQLQLYLDGPADKLVTFLIAETEGVGPRIRGERGLEPDFKYLVGRTMGDLLAAEAEATADTLAKHGRPVRTIRIDRPDEETMGALMMHYMLETIFAAALLRVDPYDQPAVEEGKVLARKYLARMG